MVVSILSLYFIMGRPGIEPGRSGLQPDALPTELTSHVGAQPTGACSAVRANCLGGTRTLDALINSQVFCQLNYQTIKIAVYPDAIPRYRPLMKGLISLIMD